jgi:hypothetical protein
VPGSAPLTQADAQRLAVFVRSGGGLHPRGRAPRYRGQRGSRERARARRRPCAWACRRANAEWFPSPTTPTRRAA